MTSDRPERRWWPCLLLALAVVYAPFVIAAIVGWVNCPCAHCVRTWLAMLWVFPGAVLLEWIWVGMTHQAPPLPPVPYATLTAILSLAIVVLAAWLLRGGPVRRWVMLIITGAAATLGAWIAYALVRF